MSGSDIKHVIREGNAAELVCDLAPESVDAVVTDPPYALNIGRLSGQSWDGEDTIAMRPEFWASVLPALKPGGLVIAFGASRTWHRLATAIEDGGFRMEETVFAWTRADKKLVDTDIAREFERSGDPVMAEVYRDGHTMFKPAVEPILLLRKPFAPGMSRLENIRTYGVGFLNFADAYTPTSEDLSRRPGAPHKNGVMFYDRGGMEKSTPHAGGRYPHNMVFLHRPSCAVEGECAFDCAAAHYEGAFPGKTRFFRSFYHTGRTPPSERIAVNGIAHLTVKPVSVMEWLVGIATLPGQVVLDPFAGSGSTLVAAALMGRSSIVFERERSFADIIRERATGRSLNWAA